MPPSREKQVFSIVILFGHLFVGIPGDKGLVIGVRNPASFTAFTEIPKNSSSSFSNVTFYVQPQNVAIISLASDSKEAVVFAIVESQILTYPNFSLWQYDVPAFTILHEGRSFAYGQIAFDFVSKNLYWSDAFLNWIAMKPANNVNSKLYKVIVHADLTSPVGLALDPKDRLMFFSDNGPYPRIEKASLDGQDREVIVHKGLLYVITLSVDSENNKLYWADYLKRTLEGCDYDGSNRRVLRRIFGARVSGLSYYENMLHAVSFLDQLMVAVDVTSGSEVYRRSFPEGQPLSITVYDTETTGYFNDLCLTLDCHHMCVSTQLGPKCLCFEGFDLDGNGKNCTDRSWYFKRGFIVSNASTFAMHVVQSANGISDVHYVELHSTDTIDAFTVDATSDTIYFVDSPTNSLKKFDIISRQISILTQLKSARDLTFDWIANFLGWIDTSQSSIRSFSINSQTSTTVYSNLQQPTSLTVDPHNGVLFWISGTSGRSIVHGSWARHEPRTLISSTHLNNPRSLQYDVNSHRLYWLDNTIIKSATTNGSDIKSHIDTGGATMAFSYKDFFGWIKGDSIYSAGKYSSKEENVIITVQNSKYVAVFDSTLQQDKRGTCDILNGGCEEICIPEVNGSRCECDIGLQLQADQTCDSDVLLKDFIVFTDNYYGRIMQVDLQTGALVKLPLSVRLVLGVAFDKSTKTIFYSEGLTNTIGSTTLHGRNRELKYFIGLTYAANLAIDFSTGNIYYSVHGSESYLGYIGVVHKNKSLHKALIHYPSTSGDIALYPSKGYLFWTEFSSIRTLIGRANMDGTSETFIITKNITVPTGLTIDFALSRLFWMDMYKNTIESSDLNGENRLVLVSESDRALFFDIVIHGQYLYYTAWHRQFITKIDKTTGFKVDFMSSHPEIGRFDNLDIYADDSRDVSSSCLNKNGFYSTFCFPTPTGRTCGCQDNVNLQSDELTCEGIIRCPTLLFNLNFTDCAPYPGQSCDFKCKPGYRRAVDDTVYCDPIGQWSTLTETLCIEHHSSPEAHNTNLIYMYSGASVAGILVVSFVIAGVICLKKRRSVIARSHSVVSTPIELSDSGYDGPCEIGFFGVDDFVIEEPMDSPYLTCTNIDK